MTVRPLTRANLAASGVPAAAAPVRIVHLGLGAFHRAHQAWYTQHAGDGWGIAAFTGRSPRQAELLAPQDGLFALVERGADGDRVEIVTSISEARDGADVGRLAQLLADPAVGVVTLTITEAGYRLGTDGELDLVDPDVQADIVALSTASGSAPSFSLESSPEARRSHEARIESSETVLARRDLLASAEGLPAASAPAATTALGRLLAGLGARRTAGAGPIAVVSCDNLPANGAMTRRALVALAQLADEGLAAWVEANVSFVSTSIDRITPATHGEVDAVLAAGWRDAATVVTEPFADWVLEGDFPAGRPAWERAGARFVDDIGPWEDRKLWLLNGAHTTLVAAGLPRGHETVAQAFADPECRALVAAFWAEAVTCLPDGVEHVRYRDQLAERFANARIEHRLAQIAAESCTKVRFRVVPIARRLRARGTDAAAAAAAIASWISWARGGGTAPDRERAAIDAALAASDPVAALLRLVAADLADDGAFASRFAALCATSSSSSRPDSVA